MNSVVLMASISIDGMFEGPDGSLAWATIDEEIHQHFNDVLRSAGGLLDGRVTHEMMAAYWPTADQEPDASPIEVDFAAIWREMPKVVYSRTLQQVSWNATLVREVDRAQVDELKGRASGDLFVGGALLAQAFAEQDLIDEYRLYVHPVVLGSGRRLFAAGFPTQALTLVESRVFTSGVVLLRYRRG